MSNVQFSQSDLAIIIALTDFEIAKLKEQYQRCNADFTDTSLYVQLGSLIKKAQKMHKEKEDEILSILGGSDER